MPKKSRRARAKHRAKLAQETQRKYSQSLKPVTAQLQLAGKVSPEVKDPTKQYQYLMPELRRIGILAGAIILILVVLSFILG
ncbi:MAG: hypothetical protein ACETVW_01375 [Dehalococcoidia bacterium]